MLQKSTFFSFSLKGGSVSVFPVESQGTKTDSPAWRFLLFSNGNGDRVVGGVAGGVKVCIRVVGRCVVVVGAESTHTCSSIRHSENKCLMPSAFLVVRPRVMDENIVLAGSCIVSNLRSIGKTGLVHLDPSANWQHFSSFLHSLSAQHSANLSSITDASGVSASSGHSPGLSTRQIFHCWRQAIWTIVWICQRCYFSRHRILSLISLTTDPVYALFALDKYVLWTCISDLCYTCKCCIQSAPRTGPRNPHTPGHNDRHYNLLNTRNQAKHVAKQCSVFCVPGGIFSGKYESCLFLSWRDWRQLRRFSPFPKWFLFRNLQSFSPTTYSEVLGEAHKRVSWKKHTYHTAGNSRTSSFCKFLHHGIVGRAALETNSKTFLKWSACLLLENVVCVENITASKIWEHFTWLGNNGHYQQQQSYQAAALHWKPHDESACKHMVS